MRTWGLGAVLLGAVAVAQIDLDCDRPAAARLLLGRIMLSEIEAAEDIHRAAMWDAFGRCPAGPAREDCVGREKARFEAAWERKKAAIQAKHRELLERFEERCRATLM
jgi:hypothetical protein